MEVGKERGRWRGRVYRVKPRELVVMYKMVTISMKC